MKKLKLTMAVALLCSSALAAAQTQPPAGQPPAGVTRSVPDLDAQVAYHRAFEAVLWAMPAVAIYRFRLGILEQPGMADNVIDAFDGPAHTFVEAITPNQVTP